MIRDQILEVLLAKADALVRRAADDLAALIHQEFVYVNAGGTMFNKAGYVETYCVSGQVVFRAQAFEDLDVRPFDGFAVATMIVRDKFFAGGRDVAGHYRALCVFSRLDGRWLWVAGQTMAVSAT